MQPEPMQIPSNTRWAFAPRDDLDPVRFANLQDAIAQRLYCWDPRGWWVFCHPNPTMGFWWSCVYANAPAELGELRFKPGGVDYRTQPPGYYRLGSAEVDLNRMCG